MLSIFIETIKALNNQTRDNIKTEMIKHKNSNITIIKSSNSRMKVWIKIF